MELTDQQKNVFKQWVEEGCSLSDLQRRVGEEFNVSMTYMDVRFLVIDLGLAVKDRPKGPKQSDQLVQGVESDGNMSAAQENVAADDDVIDADYEGVPNNVRVTVDRLTRPGSVVSGTVTFSDGITAAWILDQAGRLALESSKKDYTPSHEDLVHFQEEIKKALSRHGL